MSTKGIRSGLGQAAVLVAALAVASGCATSGMVQEEIAKANSYTDQKVGELKGDVDRVAGDVSEVGSRTDKAMTKAELAERLASGAIDFEEISTHRVHFAFDDYQLSDEARATLDNLASKLSAHARYVLEVRGYTDATGNARYNYRLARERCESVQRYLIAQHSVPASRIVPVAFGEDDPMAGNEDTDGRAQNRRVQVRLLSLNVQGEPLATAP